MSSPKRHVFISLLFILKGGEQREKKMREQCGMKKTENNHSILAPCPSIVVLLATFCAAL